MLPKEVIEEARREVKKEEAISIVLRHLAGCIPCVANCLQRRSLRLYKLNPPTRVLRHLADQTEDYSLLLDTSSSRPLDIQNQLETLSLEQLETLSLDALEFSTVEELKIYLANLTERDRNYNSPS